MSEKITVIRTFKDEEDYEINRFIKHWSDKGCDAKIIASNVLNAWSKQDDCSVYRQTLIVEVNGDKNVIYPDSEKNA